MRTIIRVLYYTFQGTGPGVGGYDFLVLEFSSILWGRMRHIGDVYISTAKFRLINGNWR